MIIQKKQYQLNIADKMSHFLSDQQRNICFNIILIEIYVQDN